jgi:signal transduction histidine kinase
MSEELSKVLIIDDEEIVLDSCTQILEGRPYHLATTMDGAFGLELIREFKPDIVFVDLKMPGMSGFDVIKEIQSFDPTIIAIVITGYATVDTAVEAIKQGAYDFLPKPFTPDEFRVITRRGLERRKLVLETTALRREKDMLREHFAAIVSHELKAPLGAIQQNLFALEHELASMLSESQNTQLTRMKSSIDNLLKLIHTWLRVISTDADIERIRDDFQPISVVTLISNAIDSVQPHATRKDIEILSSVGESLPLIFGDEITLIESLINLLSNAIKYSRMESQIHVTAQEVNGEIQIAVTDRGVGIAEEDLPFIFGDFYVGQFSPKAERGSGLGLAITRRIIQAHDGTISVESALDKGSTFMIRIPVMKEETQSEPALDAGLVSNPN